MTVKPKRAILIAGPTASGKSEVAIEVAQALDGVIINADSMQVFEELTITVAKPPPEAQKSVQHVLYSVASMKGHFSVADWLKLAKKEAEKTWAAAKIPIFTGGTGLYFKTLLHGLAEIPEIPKNIRESVIKGKFLSSGADFYEDLLIKDPETSRKLKPGDRQRIQRALEVYEATGVPLSVWQQKQPKPPFPNVNFLKTILTKEKEGLDKEIRKRFQRMIKEGAVEEAEAILRLKLKDGLSGTKAIGLVQLGEYLRNEITLEEAIEKAVIKTRQYAKRQRTWFRNQFPDWHQVEAGTEAAKTILSLAEKEFRG